MTDTITRAPATDPAAPLDRLWTSRQASAWRTPMPRGQMTPVHVAALRRRHGKVMTWLGLEVEVARDVRTDDATVTGAFWHAAACVVDAAGTPRPWTPSRRHDAERAARSLVVGVGDRATDEATVDAAFHVRRRLTGDELTALRARLER